MIRTCLICFALSCALPAVAAQPEPSISSFAQWLERWNRAEPGAPREALRAEGLKLALARRESMKRLVRTDPEQALAHQLSRTVVPLELAELIEETIDGQGTWELLGILAKDRRSSYETWIQIGERRLRTEPWGALRRLKTVPLKLKGFALDGWAAVRDDAVPRENRNGGPQQSPH